jgi:hypothetical protein
MLLARIYEVFPLMCPLCGAQMRIIAFITDGPTVRDLLAHCGEPTAPPRIAPARGPPRNRRKSSRGSLSSAERDRARHHRLIRTLPRRSLGA